MNQTLALELERFYRANWAKGRKFTYDFFRKTYGIAKSTLMRKMKLVEQGLSLKHKPKPGRPLEDLPPGALEEMINLAREDITLSCVELGKRFNISRKKVSRYLKKAGIKRLTRQEQRMVACALKGEKYTYSRPSQMTEEYKRKARMRARLRTLKRNGLVPWDAKELPPEFRDLKALPYELRRKPLSKKQKEALTTAMGHPTQEEQDQDEESIEQGHDSNSMPEDDTSIQDDNVPELSHITPPSAIGTISSVLDQAVALSVSPSRSKSIASTLMDQVTLPGSQQQHSSLTLDQQIFLNDHHISSVYDISHQASTAPHASSRFATPSAAAAAAVAAAAASSFITSPQQPVHLIPNPWDYHQMMSSSQQHQHQHHHQAQ